MTSGRWVLLLETHTLRPAKILLCHSHCNLRNVVAHADVEHRFGRARSAWSGDGAGGRDVVAGPQVPLQVAVRHPVLQASVLGAAGHAVDEAAHRLLDVSGRRV